MGRYGYPPVMTSLRQPYFTIVAAGRYLFAILLGIAAEFLAEALKFMAGAAYRAVDTFFLLVNDWSDVPHQLWLLVKDDLSLITLIVCALTFTTYWVAKTIEKLLGHKKQTALIIVSILITGLILENAAQRTFQEQYEKAHPNPKKMHALPRPTKPQSTKTAPHAP
jgi:hypothetical protein